MIECDITNCYEESIFEVPVTDGTGRKAQPVASCSRHLVRVAQGAKWLTRNGILKVIRASDLPIGENNSNFAQMIRPAAA